MTLLADHEAPADRRGPRRHAGGRGGHGHRQRWPNPDPRVFGYHEVFQVMVLLGAAMNFAVVFEMHWR